MIFFLTYIVVRTAQGVTTSPTTFSFFKEDLEGNLLLPLI